MTPPHPLRCETCNNIDCRFHLKHHFTKERISADVMIAREYARVVGCASHSAANTSAEKVLDELIERFEKACKEDPNEWFPPCRILKELRQERERR